jgi:ABC-2 type transport system ATP-binding protein
MGEPVRLHGVGKRYGSRGPWVLRGVDLELSPGSLVRVDGANGSGKSTLLALVAGIVKPSKGRVTGRGVCAYVPERLPSVLPFDVTGYLDRLGAVYGLAPEDTRQRAVHWLDRLGAAAWSRAPMSTLSKGTAQKVALAQALMVDAEVLVLDEAWTGLDGEACSILDDAVNDRVASGVTVLFVDHQQAGHLARCVDVVAVQDAGIVPVGRAMPRMRPVTPSQDLAPPQLADGSEVEIEFEDGVGIRVVRVPPTVSDTILRNMLARPGHHIRSVRTIGA